MKTVFPTINLSCQSFGFLISSNTAFVNFYTCGFCAAIDHAVLFLSCLLLEKCIHKYLSSIHFSTDFN